MVKSLMKSSLFISQEKSYSLFHNKVIHFQDKSLDEMRKVLRRYKKLEDFLLNTQGRQGNKI